MNENNNKRNPESIRAEQNFKEREQLRRKWNEITSTDSTELQARLTQHKLMIAAQAIGKANPDKSKAWAEARARERLGLPDPVRRTAPAPAPAKPARVKTLAVYRAWNAYTAAAYNIECSGAPEAVQYR